MRLLVVSELSPLSLSTTLLSLRAIQRLLRPDGARFEEAKQNAKRAPDIVGRYNGRDDFRTNVSRFTYAELLVETGELEKGLNMH